MIKFKNISILVCIILCCISNIEFFNMFNARNEINVLQSVEDKDYSVVETSFIVSASLALISIIIIFINLSITKYNIKSKE